MYETPDGGRHVLYKKYKATGEDGQIHILDDADWEHLPDFPAASLPFISSFLQHGIPQVALDMLSGKLSPVAVMKALRNGGGDGS